MLLCIGFVCCLILWCMLVCSFVKNVILVMMNSGLMIRLIRLLMNVGLWFLN